MTGACGSLLLTPLVGVIPPAPTCRTFRIERMGLQVGDLSGEPKVPGALPRCNERT